MKKPSKKPQSTQNILVKTGKYLDRTIGTMKFAVIIILLFALASTYGTFMESYHGREFASKLVYKSWWFMGMQFLMFASILTATLSRLPLKKRLYGFYTLHAGLLILFIGSFFTYVTGIDGMLELMPNQPNNRVLLEQDRFVVSYPDGTVKSFPLPNSAFPSSIDYEEPGLKIGAFLPFAKLERQWRDSSGDPMETSTVYTLYNEMLSQELVFSLNPNSDYESTQKMGPLSAHYMPTSLYSCFIDNSESGFLIWDTEKNTCQYAEAAGAEVGETPTKNRFMVFEHNGEILKFFPDFSPLPLNDDLSKRTDTPFRVFSKRIFEERPNLFLFADKAVFYTNRRGWQGRELSKDKPVKLPWMNFELLIDSHHTSMYPLQAPIYSRPVHDSGEIIEGNIQAVQIEFHGEKYWVRSDAPLALANAAGTQMRFQILPQEVILPYQITLDRFKMDTNPGTNDPASYESFVSLLDGRTSQPASQHHVFMNNPLKYDEFTFYQSSYFPIGPDEYGSAFSVNYDPGRFLKYLGSFLLVFGSAWHFYIRRSKKRAFFERESTIEKSEKSKGMPLGELNA